MQEYLSEKASFDYIIFDTCFDLRPFGVDLGKFCERFGIAAPRCYSGFQSLGGGDPTLAESILEWCAALGAEQHCRSGSMELCSADACDSVIGGDVQGAVAPLAGALHPATTSTSDAAMGPPESVESADSHASDSDASEAEPTFEDSEWCFSVKRGQPSTGPCGDDDRLLRCAALARTHLRAEPTLPAHFQAPARSWTDVDSGMRLPLYHCAFKECTWYGDDRGAFRDHIEGEHGATIRAQILGSARAEISSWSEIARRTHVCEWDCYSEAIASIERSKVPRLGLSVTRRSLRALALCHNDATTKCLVCFCCNQLKTFVGGEAWVPKSKFKSDDGGDISYYKAADLVALEKRRPNTLLNNCSYDVWYQRYVDLRMRGQGAEDEPNAVRTRRPGLPDSDSEPLADYVLGLPWCKQSHIGACDCEDRELLRLFGNCEDVVCEDHVALHAWEMREKCTGYRRLCHGCKVPICRECFKGLDGFSGVGSVPMAVANDNFYGYVSPVLVDTNATWLECAAASLHWNSMMVYYVEAPHGHLMLEKMDGPTARTQVRGNLFSFNMPWESIEKQCAREMDGHVKLPLPHSGEVLAILFQVQVVGGATDVATHVEQLEGATLRPAVVIRLIQDSSMVL